MVAWGMLALERAAEQAAQVEGSGEWALRRAASAIGPPAVEADGVTPYWYDPATTTLALTRRGKQYGKW